VDESNAQSNFNCMIISWLTPSNNSGGILLSIKKSRHSAKKMSLVGNLFTLSIACRGYEDVVLRVGACSGRDGDKFSQIPGLALNAEHLSASFPPPVRDCAAFLHCTVLSCMEGIDAAHWTIFAQANRAGVLESHWNGKVLKPKSAIDTRHILTFLGSQEFGFVTHDADVS